MKKNITLGIIAALGIFMLTGCACSKNNVGIEDIVKANALAFGGDSTLDSSVNMGIGMQYAYDETRVFNFDTDVIMNLQKDKDTSHIKAEIDLGSIGATTREFAEEYIEGKDTYYNANDSGWIYTNDADNMPDSLITSFNELLNIDTDAKGDKIKLSKDALSLIKSINDGIKKGKYSLKENDNGQYVLTMPIDLSEESQEANLAESLGKDLGLEQEDIAEFDGIITLVAKFSKEDLLIQELTMNFDKDAVKTIEKLVSKSNKMDLELESINFLFKAEWNKLESVDVPSEVKALKKSK